VAPIGQAHSAHKTHCWPTHQNRSFFSQGVGEVEYALWSALVRIYGSLVRIILFVLEVAPIRRESRTCRLFESQSVSRRDTG
jgi:hypothetical protein